MHHDSEEDGATVDYLLTHAFPHEDRDLFCSHMASERQYGRSILMVKIPFMCPIPEKSRGDGKFCQKVPKIENRVWVEKELTVA